MDPLKPKWTRLEPYSRDTTLQYGLNAEVHDPLWLLARQWQLLEFWGEDAGSPIWAELKVTCAPISRYHLRPPGVPPSQIKVEGEQLNGTVPLEVLVEREVIQREPIYFKTIEHGQPAWKARQVRHLRFAAEAGRHFVRLMEKMGAGSLRTNIIQQFSLAPPEEEKLLLKMMSDSDTLRFLQVMAGRVLDGVLLRSIFKIVLEGGSLGDQTDLNPYQNRVKTGVADWQAMTASERDMLQPIADKWKAWHDELVGEPHESSWVPPRLEYQALIAASTPQGEAVLSATEYADGHLDWYSFDAVAGASLGALAPDPPPPDNKTFSLSLIPTPVRFPGMPVSRYWEFEDAKVDFGAIAAGEQQLAHLLLIDFGLVSGDDWFIIPVTLPVGTLCYTDTLTVTDTFDVHTSIPSTRALDKDRKAKGLSPGLVPWDLFHLSGDESKTDALFLPPTLGRSLQGKSIEEVLFMRDEMANMVWAVERTIESALGRPLNQSEAYFSSRKEKTPPSAGPDAILTRLYKLASEVPSHWVPMLPVPIKPDRADRLGFTTGRPPRGRVMTELWTANQAGKPLYGEEVPREGVRISRAYQYTRWTNGESYLWVGRKNEVGRGEGSSGLVFDQLVLPEPATKTRPEE
ncbi:MAG: hypothetical protein CV088_09355 [Nitrospira sp. LK70]|nr:hypothetical protein [Nitrospira sp. LK70]